MGGRVTIPGIAFQFGGGRVYTVPPLSLGALEVLQDRIAAMQSQPALSPASIATIIDAAHAALARNYDLTREQVGDLVDVGNMLEVFECVMDVSGIKRKAAEAAAGNAQGQDGSSGGLPSTPESQRAPDGPSPTSAPS